MISDFSGYLLSIQDSCRCMRCDSPVLSSSWDCGHPSMQIVCRISRLFLRRKEASATLKNLSWLVRRTRSYKAIPRDSSKLRDDRDNSPGKCCNQPVRHRYLLAAHVLNPAGRRLHNSTD